MKWAQWIYRPHQTYQAHIVEATKGRETEKPEIIFKE